MTIPAAPPATPPDTPEVANPGKPAESQETGAKFGTELSQLIEDDSHSESGEEPQDKSTTASAASAVLGWIVCPVAVDGGAPDASAKDEAVAEKPSGQNQPLLVRAAASAGIPRTATHVINSSQARGELAFALRVVERPLPPASTTGSEQQPTSSKSEISDAIPEAANPEIALPLSKPLSERAATDPSNPAAPKFPGLATMAAEKRDDSLAQQNPEHQPEKHKLETSPIKSSSQTPTISVTEITHPASPESAVAAPPKTAGAVQAVEHIESLRGTMRPAVPKQLAMRIETPEAPAAGPNSPAQAAQSVDLVVEQRGSAMHFAVRSADPSLAGELRGSLSDLTARLNSQGFRAETWTPSDITVATTAENSMGHANDAFDQKQSTDWSGGERGSGQQSHGGRHSRDEQEKTQPDWFAELERNLFAPDRSAERLGR